MRQALAECMPGPPSLAQGATQSSAASSAHHLVWHECRACRQGLPAPLEVPVERHLVGHVDQCVLCDKVRALLLAVRRLPRNSDVFNHSVEVIDSLTRLAAQDVDADSEPSDAEPTSTQTQWSGWSGTQWRR